MAEILPPGIRTFKPRRSRISRRAANALVEQARYLVPVTGSPLDLDEIWPHRPPVVLDIGFGMGDATASMARAEPGTAILAVDIHTPGVGHLLYLIGETGIDNVRVIEGDALAVIALMIPTGSLAGVRTFFPDPWPKARHHKRRLVQPAVIDAVRSRLAAGGYWHIATDNVDYAEQALAKFSDDGRWTGGQVSRPKTRPMTGYERRAADAGRQIIDLVFRTTSGAHATTP